MPRNERYWCFEVDADREATDILRDVACSVGIHGVTVLGLCGHVVWINGEVITAEMMNQHMKTTFLPEMREVTSL